MTDNVSCKFCGTVPNAGETPCVRLDDARHCEWMGDSDWKRYNASVDKAAVSLTVRASAVGGGARGG